MWNTWLRAALLVGGACGSLAFAVNVVAEPDATIEAHSAPDDPLYSEQWYLNGDVIGAPQAWDIVTDSQQVSVALIDSGCDWLNPDIQPNLWVNQAEIPGNGIDDDDNGYVDDIHGYDFIHHRGDPEDEGGHGTMVFGILGASGNNQYGVAGVSWNARVMCLKVLGEDNLGSVSDAIKAIDYAIASGARILNISWGYTTAAPSLALRRAIERAEQAGLLVVVSAGNDGRELRDGFGEVSVYPATYGGEGMIVVASSTRQDQLAGFSNFGVGLVDLAAPGEDMLTTSPDGFVDFNGTSASAAVVTGAASLLLAEDSDLTASQVKQILMDSAQPREELRNVTTSGGRLSLSRALGLETSRNSETEDPQSQLQLPEGAAGGCRMAGEGGSTSQGLSGWIVLAIGFLFHRTKVALRAIFRAKRSGHESAMADIHQYLHRGTRG